MKRGSPLKWLAALLGFASVMTACASDECSDGEASCATNIEANCVVTAYSGNILSSPADPYLWEDKNCENLSCQVVPFGVGLRAFCALAATKDPSCPTDALEKWGHSSCVDNTIVTWNHCFRGREVVCSARQSCSEGSTGGDVFCVDESYRIYSLPLCLFAAQGGALRE